MTLARDLFDLPETVRRNDFVAMLTTNVAHPKETADSFVVTPQLAAAFGDALSRVRTALADGRSLGAYLHGSFGSGKSHFMAMLSLLLRGDEHAWRKPELHELREKNPFVGKKKLLELHFHMIGKRGLEAAVFGGYLSYVEANHPAAPTPPLFSDDELFENAETLRATLGDTKFFEMLGGDAPAQAEGWGDLAEAERWTRSRFDAARVSGDADVRAALFDALVRCELFSAFRRESSAFIEFDRGLSVISNHAKSLGYDGIVFFLDEVILWLSHRASDYGWLHNEVQKMVKLVESESVDRPIPIVSFLARQRNLAELVGDQYAGAETTALYGSLAHWEGRFDTIALEDRNLATIIEKRLLRTKGPEASAEIDRAFAELRARAGVAWDTLLGSYDAEAFRKLYPFSPALVDALVGLSQSLQRERTALRLAMEILVEHSSDLALGEVVRVGDLFDVLAGGEEPADGVMRARFDSAKRLYRHDLLPVIRERKGTNEATKCQRMRPEHPERIGCSGCAERACRTENRLVKTLLVAALVPNVPVLKNLTVGRLVALNHGSVKTVVPGTEVQKAATALRELGAMFGQLRVEGQADPTVVIGLDSVDLKPILQQARSADQIGARQKLVRELLLSAMGLEDSHDLQKPFAREWRMTKRSGQLVFKNIRKLRDEDLALPDGDAFRMIIDYPFDEPGHGPNEDLEVIERFEERGTGAWTVTWLPSFFAAAVNETLGDLVVLNHILETNRSKEDYLKTLSLEDRTRALNDLESLRSQKKQQVLLALEQAYGLRSDKPEFLDPAMSVERHVRLLKPGAPFHPRIVGHLRDALDAYIDALLESRWPRHPQFEKKITAQGSDQLVAEFKQIVDADAKWIPADRERAEKLRGTLGALGIVRLSEGKVHLVDDGYLLRIEQKRQAAGSKRPTADEMRPHVEEGRKMGLDPLAVDLVLRCYAAWTGRMLVHHGRPYEARGGQSIPDDVEFEQPDLPTATQWAKALAAAGTILGISFASRGLNGDNLKLLDAQVATKLGKFGKLPLELPNALTRRAGALRLEPSHDRARTAASGAAFFSAVSGRKGRALVEALDAFEPVTSAKAVGASLASLDKVMPVLDDELVFGTYAQLDAKSGELSGAAEILERVMSAARQDELHVSLASELRTCALEGQKLLGATVKPEPPSNARRVERKIRATRGRDAALAALEAAFGELRAEIESAEGDVVLSGSLVIVVEEPRK